MTRTSPRQAASFLQRGHLRTAPLAARGLLATGTVDDDRLGRAVTEVVAAMPLLRTDLVDDGSGLWLQPRDALEPLARTDLSRESDPHARCVDLLLADDRDEPLVRFHLVRLSDREVVLGVAAHPVILDARSRYMVLGAVWQAYFGRFRPAQYRNFLEHTGFHPVATQAAVTARRQWWTRRLTVLPDRPLPASAGRTERLRVPGHRWQSLTAASGPVGGNGALALTALTAWALREVRGDRQYFATELDLRDHLDLGAVIGPLTDRLVFGVDLAGLARPAVADLMLRAQAGFLDAVVHYLPHQDVADLAAELEVVPRWDVTVHFCRNAPSSALTRDERSLAELGVSIELFREADLLGTPEAGTGIDIRVGELGDDVVIAVTGAPAGFLAGLDTAIERNTQ